MRASSHQQKSVCCCASNCKGVLRVLFPPLEERNTNPITPLGTLWSIYFDWLAAHFLWLSCVCSSPALLFGYPWILEGAPIPSRVTVVAAQDEKDYTQCPFDKHHVRFKVTAGILWMSTMDHNYQRVKNITVLPHLFTPTGVACGWVLRASSHRKQTFLPA